MTSRTSFCLSRGARAPFGVCSASVRDPFGVRSGFVQDPFRVCSGSVRGLFGVRSGVLYDNIGGPGVDIGSGQARIPRFPPPLL